MFMQVLGQMFSLVIHRLPAWAYTAGKFKTITTEQTSVLWPQMIKI